MYINTPNPDPAGEPVVKQIEIGGGVVYTLEGFRYTVRGTVEHINEETQAVYVHAPGVKQWVHLHTIIDAFSKEDQSSQAVVDTDTAILLQEAVQKVDLSG